MSLTLAEARARAAHVSDVAYEIDLDLSDHEGETFGSSTTVTFTTTEPSTFLELTGARDLIVSVDGRPVGAAYDGRRVGLVDLPVGIAGAGAGGGPGALRQRRRRHAPDDRPRGRRDLRVGLPLARHRATGLRLLRPARPEGHDGGRRERRPALERDRQRSGRVPGGWAVALRDDAAAVPLALRRVCGAVALGDLGARGAALRLARTRVAGRRARPGRRRAAADDHRLLRPLRHALRRGLPLRLLRPALRARAQLGRDGDAGLCDLPRRAAPPRSGHRRPALAAGHGHRPRDGAHVVREPGHDALVGGHLAQRELRRLHGLPGRRRRGRLRRHARRARGHPQARGVRRRRASLDAPGGPAGHRRPRRGRGVHQLRLHLLRQGQLVPAAAGDLAGRRGLPGRGQRAPDPAPLRQRDPRRPGRRARRGVAARRAGVGGGVAAPHRLRHDRGPAPHRRRAGAGARR